MRKNKRTKEYKPNAVAKDSKGKDVSSNKEVDFSTLQSWLSYSKDLARPKQWEYFVIDQFLKGNQNITGNPQDNTITVGKDIAFPINKLAPIYRSYKSYVTRNKPKIEVTPNDTEEASITEARRQNALLRRDNRLNNIRKLNREWVAYACKFGVGYRQVGYDKTKHLSTRWTVDPRDMLFGSTQGNFMDNPYIIKSVVRTMGYWKNRYPKANVSADNEPASDEYKKLSIQIEQYQSAGQVNNDEQTAIGYEAWYRLFKPNSKGGYINKCLFTDSGVVDQIETPYKEYPFVEYQLELDPNEMYPENPIKQLISPQRLYNTLNQQLVEYNFIVNKGRYQFAKDSGFEQINTEQGQLIRHNLGRPVTALPPAPINPALQWQLENTSNDLQILSAQNDASLGKAPFAGASGDLVEALQFGDANQLIEFRENFEDALALEAQLVLSMYDLFEDEGFTMVDDEEKEPDQFFVRGKRASDIEPDKDGKVFIEDNGSYVDYLRVTSDNNVKVSLTSEFGETKQARLNFLSKLVGLGLPISFLLKYLEFPDIDDIEKRVAEEFVVQQMQEQKQETQQPQVDVEGEQDRIRQLMSQGA